MSMDQLRDCLALPDNFRIERVIQQQHQLTLRVLGFRGSRSPVYKAVVALRQQLHTLPPAA